MRHHLTIWPVPPTGPCCSNGQHRLVASRPRAKQATDQNQSFAVPFPPCTMRPLERRPLGSIAGRRSSGRQKQRARDACSKLARRRSLGGGPVGLFAYLAGSSESVMSSSAGACSWPSFGPAVRQSLPETVHRQRLYSGTQCRVSATSLVPSLAAGWRCGRRSLKAQSKRSQSGRDRLPQLRSSAANCALH